MASFEAPVGELSDAEVEAGAEGVEEGALADARVAAEEDGAAGDEVAEAVEAAACEGGDLEDGVADGAVEADEFLLGFAELGVDEEVALVEDDGGGDMVGLGGDQQAVDEAGGGAGQAEGGDDAEAVDVGGDDVGLLAEFGGAAHDVVAAVGHVVDDASAVGLALEADAVAHGHGVGLLVAAQTVVAAQTAVDGFSGQWVVGGG